MRTGLLALCGVVAWTALADVPRMSLRLRGLHTATSEQWEKTFRAIRENPGCCDEVWFSTGIGVPPLAWHQERAAYLGQVAADLRRLGIQPGLQIQATLGHSDNLSSLEDCSAKNWTGWTGETGVEDKYCNCPRQPGFLAYVRGMARAYAAFKPSSAWIDDDLRIGNHRPATDKSFVGCWCATCVGAFNAETGGHWTRETLAAARKADAELSARWKRFSDAGIAAVAAAIAEEFHRISPTTRLGYQHGFAPSHLETVRTVVAALRKVGGKVGLRPGGGYYYDINPSQQVIKSLMAARFQGLYGDADDVDVWCPEVESWPRTYGGRSAQSVLVESFSAFMYGLNATSMLILDTRYEEDALYSRTLLKPLADAAPVLLGYVRANDGAQPAGYAVPAELANDALYKFALTGIPVLPGVGRSLGALTAADCRLDICARGSKDIQQARDALDARAGGAPAVVTSPFVGLMVPQVAVADGTLRTVAILNTRIDVQGPVSLRLRAVPKGTQKAVWRALRCAPVELPLMWSGDVAQAEIPEIGAWNAGYLAFGD